MLAYSSVAHISFIITGVIADNAAEPSATLFYLVAYSLAPSARSPSSA
jgi:NADH-quinone oxidoreductase subunit N